MQDFIHSFIELGQGCKVFLILSMIFFIVLIVYLIIQSIRHKEF